MYFLHAINSDRQTRLMIFLGQIAMILGDKKNPFDYLRKFSINYYLTYIFCFWTLRNEMNETLKFGECSVFKPDFTEE